VREESDPKPIVFSNHARKRMHERGADEDDVIKAIRIGEREAAQRGLILYRLNLEFHREWDGRYYRMQQIAPVVAEEADRLVVVTVYTFYFQEGGKP
jgi:hypothetical protein